MANPLGSPVGHLPTRTNVPIRTLTSASQDKGHKGTTPVVKSAGPLGASGVAVVGNNPKVTKSTNNAWNSSKDPIVSNGAPGFRITASGRVVNGQNQYVTGTQKPAPPPKNPNPSRTEIGTLPGAPKVVKLPDPLKGPAATIAGLLSNPTKVSLPPTTDKTTTAPRTTKTRTAPATVASQVRAALTQSGSQVPQLPTSAGTVGAQAPLLPGAASYVSVQTPNLDPYAGRTAGQVAGSELNPQLSLISGNTAAETNAIRGMYQAIINNQKGYVPQVGADYNQAQQTVNGLAQTAGAQLAAANPNDADQALLASIGAPQSQQDALASKLQAAFNGGGAVLGTVAGAIPSASLAAQKAAALQYAQTLPQIQGLAATSAVKNLQYQAGLQKNQVEAQAPTIENNVLAAKASAKGGEASFEAQQNAAIASNALARAGYAQNNAALGLKAGQQSFDNGITITKLNLDYKKLSDSELKEAAGIGLTQTRLQQQAKKFNAQTVASQQKTLTAVSKEMENWYYGKAGTQHFDTKTRTWVQAPNGTPPLSYTQAISRAVSLGLPFQAAVAVANAYYQPGEGGRPTGELTPSAASVSGTVG